MKNTTGSRILVTGLGVISAAGMGVDSLWASVTAGRAHTTVRTPSQVDRPLAVYAVPSLPPASPGERRLTRPADRAAQLALAAAKEAWAAAQLDVSPPDPARCGLVVGSSRGPAEMNARAVTSRKKNPTNSVYTAFSSIAGIISAVLPIRGCSLMTSATCISGAMAMKTAMQLIHSGEFDLVLAGGVDAPLVDSLLAQFAATHVLALETGSGALRPFDGARTGTVLGEGAAFVVLESETSAQRRRATVYGIVHHVAVGCDSILRSGGDKGAEGLRATAQQALRAMDLVPRKIDVVHLHGTGTRVNDSGESQAVRALFGPEKEQPFSWASKGITGHTLGASSLFQVVLTLQAMSHSFLPGTLNCEELDPECPIRPGPRSGAPWEMKKALCLTSGFWGNTACIVLEKWSGHE